MSPISMEAHPDRQDDENLTAARARAPRLGPLPLVLVSATGGALLALLAVAALILWSAGRDRHAELPVIGQAPQYQLVNQNGKSVPSQDFAGKVQIVTALFPYCRELCPLVAANLAGFHNTVGQQSDMKGHVVFVFFNVAPADAGPADMRTFLKQYGWKPDDPAVQFLTGSPEEIERVVQRGYHIAYYRTQDDGAEDSSTIRIENSLADRVKPDFDVKHADAIEVVDGAGRIRKVFDDSSRLDDMRLQSVIGPLLADASAKHRRSD